MTGAAPSTRLRIVCTGTGRDGTVSLSHMFRDLFEGEGAGRTVMHEYMSREFGHCYADFMDTGDEKYREQARRFIRECPYDCIVGAGYAPWLPVFAEVCGPDVKLVHLRRRDRNRCIDSLVENAQMFPAAYGGYRDSDDAIWRRMAGFHSNQMTREEWFKLPLRDRLAWYFDETHLLIDRYTPLFAEAINLETETLDDAASRALIGRVAGLSGRSPAAKHLNSHIFASSASTDQRSRMQWLFGQLDLKKAAAEDAYALEYFLNAFVAWTGYQIRQSEQISPADYRTGAELEIVLDRVANALDQTRRLVSLLQAERDERFGKQPLEGDKE